MSILGKFLYITVLLLNAICIPSEDRFLARVGLAPGTYQRGFGQDLDTSVKHKIIQLIASVRTVMRVNRGWVAVSVRRQNDGEDKKNIRDDEEKAGLGSPWARRELWLMWIYVTATRRGPGDGRERVRPATCQVKQCFSFLFLIAGVFGRGMDSDSVECTCMHACMVCLGTLRKRARVYLFAMCRGGMVHHP
ncbi:Yos1-domain-containing protein [Thermothelomyces heterothallicus CBS 203.75]